MGWQIYIILGLLAVIAIALRGAVRWWNLPKTIEARNERRRLIAEYGWFGWRKRRHLKLVDPKDKQ